MIFLRNEDYASTHMFASVRIGLEYLKDKVDTVLFTPVDVPLFTARTVTQMLSLGYPLVTPVCDGNPGHPLLIRSTLIDSILSDDGSSGLEGAVGKCGTPMYFLNVDDPGIIHDADTPRIMLNFFVPITRVSSVQKYIFSWHGKKYSLMSSFIRFSH